MGTSFVGRWCGLATTATASATAISAAAGGVAVGAGSDHDGHATIPAVGARGLAALLGLDPLDLHMIEVVGVETVVFRSPIVQHLGVRDSVEEGGRAFLEAWGMVEDLADQSLTEPIVLAVDEKVGVPQLVRALGRHNRQTIFLTVVPVHQVPEVAIIPYRRPDLIFIQVEVFLGQGNDCREVQIGDLGVSFPASRNVIKKSHVFRLLGFISAKNNTLNNEKVNINTICINIRKAPRVVKSWGFSRRALVWFTGDCTG